MTQKTGGVLYDCMAFTKYWYDFGTVDRNSRCGGDHDRYGAGKKERTDLLRKRLRTLCVARDLS